ncbi:helix-turn-helix domain-containing protein [Pedobacter frigiditerrae]|uniref:helix-turn-helix domain-containing protein n=1 Tax=Pedobacter frigiditerrae TaxID=2530452 RepID=UPI0013F14593|nr:helix-turn-helix transcriptional regulator [Pedobacter frigiditerrae]
MLAKEEQDIFYKKLGGLIRSARKNAKYKQEFLAMELGLTRTSLVNIEHGNQKIQLHVLLDLARIINVEVTELLPKLENDKSLDLNSKFEVNLSKEIEQKFDDRDLAMQKLKHFYKITQYKKR